MKVTVKLGFVPDIMLDLNTCTKNNWDFSSTGKTDRSLDQVCGILVLVINALNSCFDPC